jgi:hypothetical protein
VRLLVHRNIILVLVPPIGLIRYAAMQYGCKFRPRPEKCSSTVEADRF